MKCLFHMVVDCWAKALSRGHRLAVVLPGSSRSYLTDQMILDGVDERHWCSGKGITSLKHVKPFMELHCEKMIIHRRPTSDSFEDYKHFEDFILSLLEKGSVAVAIDYASPLDFKRRAFEKFPLHVLMLTRHGNDLTGKEKRGFWELQESNGDTYYGDDGGFIKMPRHQCLIKQVIEFKVNLLYYIYFCFDIISVIWISNFIFCLC